MLHMQTDKIMPSRHFGNICQFFMERTDCGLLIAFKQSCFKKKNQLTIRVERTDQYLNDSLH